MAEEGLTSEQYERLRKILKAHERSEWLWSVITIWVTWIGSVLSVMVAGKVLVGDFLMGFLR